jgi:hypothetical protein
MTVILSTTPALCHRYSITKEKQQQQSNKLQSRAGSSSAFRDASGTNSQEAWLPLIKCLPRSAATELVG